jgi:hypothetical protein
MPTDMFVIDNAHGQPMITVTRSKPGLVDLTVRSRRKGEPITITTEEAAQLAAELQRRIPMIGSPSAAAIQPSSFGQPNESLVKPADAITRARARKPGRP